MCTAAAGTGAAPVPLMSWPLSMTRVPVAVRMVNLSGGSITARISNVGPVWNRPYSRPVPNRPHGPLPVAVFKSRLDLHRAVHHHPVAGEGAEERISARRGRRPEINARARLGVHD